MLWHGSALCPTFGNMSWLPAYDHPHPSGELQQREVIEALDGEEIARLMDGESVTREISPGHHPLHFA